MGLCSNRPLSELTPHRTRVPVWYMRQAGRYSAHYRAIKERANGDFIKMCTDPRLAAEITLGPIEECGFDAAILFSDILFPLDHLGLGLTYGEGGGGPKLARLIEGAGDLQKILKSFSPLSKDQRDLYSFQREALSLIRPKLPNGCDLLGFIGGPFTLFTYAIEGVMSGVGGKGNLTEVKRALHDGRYEEFIDAIFPLLLESMIEQRAALSSRGSHSLGADAIAIFDTAAGELSFSDYQEFVLPVLEDLIDQYKKLSKERLPKETHHRVVYYLKNTNDDHLTLLTSVLDANDIVGIDWRASLPRVLKEYGRHFYIQGNIDPSWLCLEWELLEEKLADYWQEISSCGAPLDRWICGLGHGVLKDTPEENVKKSIKFIKDHFIY